MAAMAYAAPRPAPFLHHLQHAKTIGKLRFCSGRQLRQFVLVQRHGAAQSSTQQPHPARLRGGVLLPPPATPAAAAAAAAALPLRPPPGDAAPPAPPVSPASPVSPAPPASPVLLTASVQEHGQQEGAAQDAEHQQRVRGPAGLHPQRARRHQVVQDQDAEAGRFLHRLPGRHPGERRHRGCGTRLPGRAPHSGRRQEGQPQGRGPGWQYVGVPRRRQVQRADGVAGARLGIGAEAGASLSNMAAKVFPPTPPARPYSAAPRAAGQSVGFATEVSRNSHQSALAIAPRAALGALLCGAATSSPSCGPGTER